MILTTKPAMPKSKPKRGGQKTSLKRARKDEAEPEPASSTGNDSPLMNKKAKTNSSMAVSSQDAAPAKSSTQGPSPSQAQDPQPAQPASNTSTQPPLPIRSLATANTPPEPPPDPLTSPAQTTPAYHLLSSKISTLQTQLTTLKADITTTYAQLAAQKPHALCEPSDQAAAEAITKRHIKLLHDYNEIKDVGLGLMGMIADARGVRLGVVMEEFGVGGKLD